MTLLSMQDSASSTGRPLNCEHCDSGDSAVSRCSDCSVFLCEFCVTAHKRINATKNHQILSLIEVKKLGSKALAKPMLCSKHKGETLKLFCSTCQKTVCRDCTIVDHHEHKYDFVTDVAEKEKGVIRGFLTKAKVKEHAVVDGIKAVQTMKNGVQKRVSEVNKEIDAFYDEQVKALNYYCANIKHEVSTQGKIRVNKLENQAAVLSSFLAQLRSGISFTDQALQDGDDVKLLAMKKQLVQQLVKLNSSKTSCKPCMDDYLELQKHQTIWDMGEILSVCYDVPFDPQKCTISMAGGEEGVMYQTLAGQEVDLLLLVKDKNGQKKPKGGNHVEAIFSFCFEPGLVGANSPVPVRDNGDGSYSFSYHPVEEGNVNLFVRVEKQEVCGSPFEWNVISKLPDGASSPQRKVCVDATHEVMGTFMGFEPVLSLVQSAADVTGPSVFTEGMYCWKLQLTSFKVEIDCELEIGVTASGYNSEEYGYSTSWGKSETQQQQYTSGEFSSAIRRGAFVPQQQQYISGEYSSAIRRGQFAPQQQQYTSGEYSSAVRRGGFAPQQQQNTSGQYRSAIRRGGFAPQQQQYTSGQFSGAICMGEFAPQQQQYTSGQYSGAICMGKLAPQQQQYTSGQYSGAICMGEFAPQQKQYTSGEYDCSTRKGGPPPGFVQQQQQEKWSWKYRSFTKSPQSSRSDGQVPSITSVEDNDVFIVFLNLETQKLTIYNVRSKQTEIFTGIEGGVSSITRIESPNAWGGKATLMLPYNSAILALQ